MAIKLLGILLLGVHVFVSTLCSSFHVFMCLWGGKLMLLLQACHSLVQCCSLMVNLRYCREPLIMCRSELCEIGLMYEDKTKTTWLNSFYNKLTIKIYTMFYEGYILPLICDSIWQCYKQISVTDNIWLEWDKLWGNKIYCKNENIRESNTYIWCIWKCVKQDPKMILLCLPGEQLIYCYILFGGSTGIINEAEGWTWIIL